jgi:hypothetical protein
MSGTSVLFAQELFELGHEIASHRERVFNSDLRIGLSFELANHLNMLFAIGDELVETHA